MNTVAVATILLARVCADDIIVMNSTSKAHHPNSTCVQLWSHFFPWSHTAYSPSHNCTLKRQIHILWVCVRLLEWLGNDMANLLKLH